MSDTVGTTQVIERLVAANGGEAPHARALLSAFQAAVVETLKAGRDVGFAGFAKLKVAGRDGAATEPFPGDGSTARIARQAGAGAPDAEQFVAAALGVFRETLLAGHRLFLDDFVTLQVVEEKAKIVKDPASGQRTIQPARNRIAFGVADPVRAALDGAEVAFLPSKALKEEVQRLKTASILLVVPARDFFAETIEYHFQRAGWQVITATTCEAARARLDEGGIYLVLQDAAVTGEQKLAEHLKLRRQSSLVPLVVMHPGSVDLNKATIFRIVGNEQVVQPFEVKQLLDIAEAELARASEEETIFEQEVIFQFPTDDQTLDRANEHAARLFEASGLDEEGQVALSAAFREALGNAAQHGNKHRRDRMIEVLYLLDKEKITCSVTDSGDGFDHRNYVVSGREGNAIAAARRRHAEGKMGGLGIMLMLKCTDNLGYNEKGNVVTLTKYLDPKRRRADGA